MKYIILKQFIPGNDQIWVAKLDSNDPEYSYDSLEEAEAKKLELELEDSTRGFKIVETSA